MSHEPAQPSNKEGEESAQPRKRAADEYPQRQRIKASADKQTVVLPKIAIVPDELEKIRPLDWVCHSQNLRNLRPDIAACTGRLNH